MVTIRQPVPFAEDLLPQGAVGVFALDEPALAQGRDHMVDEILVGGWDLVVHQVDAVDAGVLPGRQFVGDLLRGPDDPETRRGVMGDVAQRGRTVLDEVTDPPDGRLHALGLDLADRGIEIIVTEVDADRARHVREVPVVVDPLVQFCGDTCRFGLGGGGHDVEPLEEERGALRARRHEVRPLDLIPLADMVDAVDLVVVGVDSGLTILQQRVVIPAALPQLVGDVDVLVGPCVACVVRGEPLESEVAAGVGQVVGDDVPRDTALRRVVEGRDAACEVERVFLQDARGERNPQMFGGIGDGARQHTRVVAGHLETGLEVLPLVPLPDSAVDPVAICVGGRDRTQPDRPPVASRNL